MRYAIGKVLGPKLIKFPTTKEGLEKLTKNFEDKFGFPMAVGCIDGTHIPVCQPNKNPHDYFCCKMKHSINVQAVCDHEGCFLDVDCSWSGSVHDAKVFGNSAINKLFQENKLPNVEKKLNSNDIDVPPVLLGDLAYPLLPSALKEYSTCTSDDEAMFNIMLCSVRNQIECAFGRLKARWRILNRPMDLAIEHVPSIVYACFVLHNFCESRKASIYQEAVNKEINNEQVMQDCHHHQGQGQIHSYNSANGALVRDVIKHMNSSYILDTKHTA